MKMYTPILVLALFFVGSSIYADELYDDARSRELRLFSGEVVVASEGILEPRSVGSYVLRIYSKVEAGFPYDNFITGAIRPRDGFLERIVAHDFDQDGIEEIVVILVSVGTGSYIAADAFTYEKGTLSVLAAVVDLAKDADPIQALAQAIASKKHEYNPE